MNVSCYLNKEETELFKEYPKGWLKELVLREMRTAAKGAESPSQVDEERAREYFPPKLAFPSGTSKTPAYVPEEPVKDVFGPRLKR